MYSLTQRSRLYSLCAIISLGLFWSLAQGEVNCPGKGKVCRVIATSLPLRARSRPMSTLYSAPDTGSKIITSNLKAFAPMYVFERKDVDFSDPVHVKGWYKVGTTVRAPWAWVQAKDVFEWKYPFVVSYTHPGTGDERRNPVLMFRTKEALADVVSSDEREMRVGKIYEGLNATPVDVPDNVISREPARFVNIEDKFYMLQVIDFEMVDLFLEDARYLQITTALPGGRVSMKESAEKTEIRTLGFDIKFVMDMTGSMGPYIDRTKAALAQVAGMNSQNSMDAHIRYGLVGYRDDVTKIPAMEFTVKNFTESLVDGTDFQKVIATAAPAQSGSADYQEEVFAGVKEAIASAWNENTIRFIVLVGDASSHVVGHPQNTSGLNAPDVRKLADADNVFIMAIHLKDRGATHDHALAQKQFSQLATNPGTDAPAYISIDADNHDEFERAVKQASETLSEIVAATRKGDVQSITKNALAISTIPDAGDKGGDVSKAMAAAALVDYLGKEATQPKDITAWVLDRDLTDPDNIQALEVRVLLKKSDLNDLIQALEMVQTAMKRGNLTQMAFFDALQGVVAIACSISQNQITIDNATILAETGLLPAWIESLPYKSDILEMSDDMFESMSSYEKAHLVESVDSKLELYRKIHENTDLWVALDERDASVDYVYPLPLSALP